MHTRGHRSRSDGPNLAAGTHRFREFLIFEVWPTM